MAEHIGRTLKPVNRDWGPAWMDMFVAASVNWSRSQASFVNSAPVEPDQGLRTVRAISQAAGAGSQERV
ncbi:hypothetical protein RB623_24705 [Mesorhizobium sp. LHD-90]|uniref:hypothetical protein n=1 Tax=Mesorhizobium sp. LHD-90 TaxID=3071414 RepID=UPI0027E1F7B2|nr:hypothetical protein [Mesorhizobium sp. LHD-90]MDQ6437265.1 hypothetical protein [Mesorhizobium sp. LHD-90]